jgi:hypothetical protein
MSSASLNDPSTGDFDLELPSGAVESVEVLASPFAAEYGRFTTSLTQVRTKRGTNEWTITPGSLMPSLSKGPSFIHRFEPRLSVSGPLKRDRLLLGQHVQYRLVRTPVESLPGEPLVGLDSFDSFTRLDAVLSSRHALTGGVIYFPRKITNATLSTFRPPETTMTFTQEGFSAGLVDRLILSDWVVLESTLAGRTFEVNEKVGGDRPMIYAPQSQGGNFFNRQERHVNGLQVVEALSISKDRWLGQHVFKLGFDLQHSAFEATASAASSTSSASTGRLPSAMTYNLASQKVEGTEVTGFVQDRWRCERSPEFELGIRLTETPFTERLNCRRASAWP